MALDPLYLRRNVLESIDRCVELFYYVPVWCEGRIRVGNCVRETFRYPLHKGLVVGYKIYFLVVLWTKGWLGILM